MGISAGSASERMAEDREGNLRDRRTLTSGRWYELQMADETETSVALFIDPGPVGTDDLVLRFPVEYFDEITELLDEHELSHSTAIELSAGTDLAIETVRALATPEGLASLAAVIHAIVRRNSKKRFRLERKGLSVTADGYSKKEVADLLSQVANIKVENDKKIRKQLGYDIDD